MTARELRDALEKAQAEKKQLQAELRDAQRELERLATLLQASRLEHDRLVGLWLKGHTAAAASQPAFEVRPLVAYLKRTRRRG